MTIESTRSYPDTRKVDGREVTLRPMMAGDSKGMLNFAQALPEHDLLFLPRDITDPEGIAEWVAEIDEGDALTILAMEGAAILGFSTIRRSSLRWTAHVATLHVMVAERVRGLGLGRVLTQEAFTNALGMGIEKMVAQMTVDQRSAVATFENLGFKPEALLREQVKDRTGKKHDLLVLSHDVSRFQQRRAAYGMEQAFGS